ncbi:MAG: hypothetical protein AAB727_01845 [Patescibacteria group bacterium]
MKKSGDVVLAFVASAVLLGLFINIFDKRVTARKAELQSIQAIENTVSRLEGTLSRLEEGLRDVFVEEFVKNPYATLSEYMKTVGPYLAILKSRVGEGGFTAEEKKLSMLHEKLEREVSVAMKDPRFLKVRDFNDFGIEVPIYSACIFIREDVVPFDACDDYLARLAPFYYDALRQHRIMDKRIF